MAPGHTSERYFLILLAVLKETASASLSLKESDNASASLSLKEAAWGTAIALRALPQPFKEAASAPCTAGIGLQPFLINHAPDGLLRQGDTVKARVYAVNLCVEDFHMTTVDATIRGNADNGDHDNDNSGRFCIKPASQFDETHQWYVPTPKYYQKDTVKALRESLSIHPEQSPDFFELTDEIPYWCTQCTSGACFTMRLNNDFPLYAKDEKKSIYLFTVMFKLSETITEDMAADTHIAFQVQTRPAAVSVTDQQCIHQNEGGGQGTVPYRFAQATSSLTSTDTSTTRTRTTRTSTSTTDITTTRTSTSSTGTTTTTSITTMCTWPCCAELRSFVDNVVEFFQDQYSHSVAGGARAGVCSEKCFAASGDEWCPTGGLTNGYPASTTVTLLATAASSSSTTTATTTTSTPSPQLGAGGGAGGECSCAPPPAPSPASPSTSVLSWKQIVLIAMLCMLCAVLVKVISRCVFCLADPPPGDPPYTPPPRPRELVLDRPVVEPVVEVAEPIDMWRSGEIVPGNTIIRIMGDPTRMIEVCQKHECFWSSRLSHMNGNEYVVHDIVREGIIRVYDQTLNHLIPVPLECVTKVQGFDVEEFLVNMFTTEGGVDVGVHMADVVLQIEADNIDITIVHDYMSSHRFRELFRVEGEKLFRL